MDSHYNSSFNREDFKDFLISTTKMVFDQIPVPINFIDKDCKIIVMNQAFLDYLGLSLEEVSNKHITEIDPTVRLPLVLATRKAEVGKKHKFKDGREAIVHRIPLFYRDELIGGVGVILFDDMNYLYNLVRENKLFNTTEAISGTSDFTNIYKAKYTFDNIISNSFYIDDCKEKSLNYSKTDFNILITGESGVGKELFAHAIHNSSARKDQAFVPVNCAAIPETLIESEFFGYEKGSFTGAHTSGKKGKFEIANNGTIFLDEVGELPMNIQAKLLRVLQENEIEKIGSTKIIKINTRVIAATNCDLEKKIEEGTFRKDLYYRLNLLSVEIPPLRDRKGDIELLTQHFLTTLYQKYNILRVFSDDVIKSLREYPWYGNVRELVNVVTNLAVNTQSNEVTMDDVPSYLIDGLKNKKVVDNSTISYNLSGNNGLKDILENVEIDVIKKTLQKNNYNKTKTANELGIPRMTLYRKLKSLGI